MTNKKTLYKYYKIISLKSKTNEKNLVELVSRAERVIIEMNYIIKYALKHKKNLNQKIFLILISKMDNIVDDIYKFRRNYLN